MKLGLRNTGTLGDSLFLTPAIWGLKNRNEEVIVQMHKDEQCKAVSAVFDGLCPVEFIDEPEEKIYHINNDDTHYAQRVLNHLSISDVNCIPKIALTENEILWAKEFLKEYENPIAIVNDNSGCNDPNNHRAHYVRPPVELMQDQVNLWLKEGNSLLQFGRKEDDKFTPLEDTIKIRGLTIRQLASCYRIIGKLISGDTGDYHLMLAVGGEAAVLVPAESQRLGYLYNELHYQPKLWKDEKIRVAYMNFHTGEILYSFS